MCKHAIERKTLHMRISTETILTTLNNCRTIAAQPQKTLHSSVVLTELVPKVRRFTPAAFQAQFF
jgi:hypothetical protein